MADGGLSGNQGLNSFLGVGHTARSPRTVNRSRERPPCAKGLWGQARPEVIRPHSGVQVVEAPLSALGAWLSKYVKFPLSLGGRM